MRPVVTVRLDELEDITVAGCHYRPVRRPLGITAFGANAYSADAGEQLIEPHDETGFGSGRHEELYVMVRGHATFTLGGEEVDAPAGSLVFVPEPETRREAVATEDRTMALAVGGPEGAAGPISPWEWYFGAAPLADAGNWAGAYDFTAQGLADHPGNPSLHYNLGCYAAMAGRREEALDHLRQAFAGEPKTRARAAEDSDLESLRDDPAFRELLEA